MYFEYLFIALIALFSFPVVKSLRERERTKGYYPGYWKRVRYLFFLSLFAIISFILMIKGLEVIFSFSLAFLALWVSFTWIAQPRHELTTQKEKGTPSKKEKVEVVIRSKDPLDLASQRDLFTLKVFIKFLRLVNFFEKRGLLFLRSFNQRHFLKTSCFLMELLTEKKIAIHKVENEIELVYFYYRKLGNITPTQIVKRIKTFYGQNVANIFVREDAIILQPVHPDVQS